ncbi:MULTISPECIES: biopolymer transporter ExbD [unclassified Rhizobacter]|uniref:ExbD/TolR family protein n=1 Tax=unclassified Rhizobacter TaxID=2640088 RepID=UPI0006F5F1A4|nr:MULTISPECIES: biopolymer transporter ExbD [unclassified Rhizobacter]KQU65943.1 biopolymer transporter ExbD [Rhizobacter sp. Root29]KQV97916.1 biopolymer transporter ExbD [Rhizobacter sp. Root1238]KRB18698.1 biopolymer transporter ExbD [Rhizobacter sp. Root16D2]
MAARRRLRKETAHLEITAFINLIVVLVPFLLSTAVFSRLAVIDISLPAKNTAVEQLKVDNLQLEVVLRPDSLEIGDRIGGLIQRIPNTATGYDTAALSALIQQIKAKFPDKVDASVLAEPNTPYDALVQVMDSVRVVVVSKGATLLHTELFPNISIGDAPVVKR